MRRGGWRLVGVGGLLSFGCAVAVASCGSDGAAGPATTLPDGAPASTGQGGPADAGGGIDNPSDGGPGSVLPDGGAGDSGPCAPGLTFCNGACVQTRTDPQHCGACNAAGQTALWSVPIAGGEWTKLKTFASHIHIDGNGLYGQADPSGFVKIPLGGGATVVLSASRTAVPGAFDATSVYWSENTSTGVGRLMKLWPK